MNKIPPPKPKRTPGVYAFSQPYNYNAPPTAPPRLCSHLDENIFQFPPVIRDPLNCDNQHEVVSSQDQDSTAHCCAFCQPYREDRNTIEPLKTRLNSAIEAMDRLNQAYALLDNYMEQKLESLKDVIEDAGNQKMDPATATTPVTPTAIQKGASSKQEVEFELEHSLTFLESFFGTEVVPILKSGAFKRIRGRSKSMMEDEIHTLSRDRSGKISSNSSRPYLLRRQSTYSDSKSKVSKWTKVKAAFKWERANVLTATASEGTGLSPVNNEVARYLRVPANPCGGSSSADSIISSSSGHFLSDTGGTPGTISSASSVDDIDASCRNAIRRNSSKSDTRCDSRGSDFDLPVCELRKSATDDRLDSLKQAPPTKSFSNKSIRRSKAFSDFEVLPEDHVADIKSTSGRRNKLPPSPLNLNQDLLNDLPIMYSPNSVKSPKDGTQSLNRMKRINSPGNSSVPSSPSRHSDFFGELESEELSSGDFSEPTTPNRKTMQQKQEEVFKRYQALQNKLDLEFKAKQREFEYKNSNLGLALRGSVKSDTHPPTPLSSKVKFDSEGLKTSNEHSPTQAYSNYMVPTELLEEKLTPEFKRKLHAWRNKMIGAYGSQPHTPVEHMPNPSDRQMSADSKSKIDWYLWSTGQVKLAGQGLTALPHQKDLPEKFQKKLEQWNKIKSGGGTVSDNDSLKRSSKHNQSTRRGSDDDRWYKHKPHDKEKLAKLKAIVTPDHQSKNIEVKTAAGVMKFEGISRKFTRKLYEWEKARGIGPEASTFALLPPGYCQIDARRFHKENRNVASENSPTLSRSLSLDSVAPSVPLAVISQQASSLSLNDVHELQTIGDSTDALSDSEYKKEHEPEAVMVEVEEEIDDTASPLVTAHTLVEQQTPIYKYEEVQCNDYCNSRRVQSFESHTNVAPLLGALKRADELFTALKKASPEISEDAEMRNCQTALLNIRSIYPYYSNNLMKANVLNAISDVQNELGRLTELSYKAPLSEACCQEIIEERQHEYNEEFHGLFESLECLKQYIQGGNNRPSCDIVPDINIINEDGNESSVYGTGVSTSRDQLSTTLEATDEHSGISQLENDTETTNNPVPSLPYRAGNGTNVNVNGAKKKLRLRKMGSRQNSKTESDSSDADTVQTASGTPRRLRRKNFRLKQRSLDDDYRQRSEETAYASAPNNNDDVLYTLKVKPGQPIEQSQIVSGTKVIGFVPPPLGEQHTLNYNTNSNVFVKTKRKLFTTIVEPNAAEGIAVIEKELESPESSEEQNFNIPKTVEEATSHINYRSESGSKKPKFYNLHKSISWNNWPTIISDFYEDTRKVQSLEQLSKLSKRSKMLVRPPLASDSFGIINKIFTHSTKNALGKSSSEGDRRNHLYKKNSIHKSNTKIENMISKTNSGSQIERSSPAHLHIASKLPPNKLDNTLPRIQRKLDGKTLTPTKATQFLYPPDIKIQLPTEVERPVTPFSERAMKLQKAKAEFLQSAPLRSATTSTIVEAAPHKAVVHMANAPPSMLSPLGATPKSQQSVNASTVPLESLSVPSSPHQSDIGTDQESISGVYNSLPRSVSRSGKISSKLGFATLASKLRRVKDVASGGSKKSKDTHSSCSSALSALCRQTLLADIIAIPQQPEPTTNSVHQINPYSEGHTPRNNVFKSQSSPQAVTRSETVSSSRLNDGINKSLSEQYVKQLKESDV